MDAVHRVRTGARRLEAVIEALVEPLDEPFIDAPFDDLLIDPLTASKHASKHASMARQARPPLADLREPARDWLRQLKKIRRAAGPVRDLDVHRRLLRAWTRDLARRPGESQPASPQAMVHGGRSLEKRLRERREALAAKLSRSIERRTRKLERRRQAFFFAARQLSGGGVAAWTAGAGSLALREFLQAAAAMRALSAANLHTFRKSVKRARYLAESDAADPHAKRFAKVLKGVQDRIGVWRDWQCLAAEAQSALGERGQPLAAAFERRAEDCVGDAVQAALEAVQEARRRLANEMSPARSRGGRRPPGRAAAPIPHGGAAARGASPGAGSAA